MKLAELAQHLLAARGQMNANEPLVLGAVFFADESASLGSLDKAHDGVVSLLQEFRKFREVRPATPREAGDAEQQLVLQRSDAVGACRPFAEAQELAQPIAKARQAPGHRNGRLD